MLEVMESPVHRTVRLVSEMHRIAQLYIEAEMCVEIFLIDPFRRLWQAGRLGEVQDGE
jgi:hypothetical protein